MEVLLLIFKYTGSVDMSLVDVMVVYKFVIVLMLLILFIIFMIIVLLLSVLENVWMVRCVIRCVV